MLSVPDANGEANRMDYLIWQIFFAHVGRPEMRRLRCWYNINTPRGHNKYDTYSLLLIFLRNIHCFAK